MPVRIRPLPGTRARAPYLAVLCALLLPVGQACAGTPLDLSAYRGQVVYVDFWASWCTPCRHSFPWMQAMKDAHEHQGLAVIAVNLDQNHADAEGFLSQFHPSFEIRFDPAGDTTRQFKVEGMPTSVLVDRHGVVRYTDIGFKPADSGLYEKRLLELLAEK